MSRLCFGCMRQKENSICEHCGFDENTQNLPHQLPIGTVLQNQYLVGRVLGQGGFGITYVGWDQQLSIPVAIKEYYPAGVVQRHTRLSTKLSCISGEAPEVFRKHRDRFLKEARTLAQFSGTPEIVQIRSFFPENDTAYIVMEYVQGVTLKEYVKKLGRTMTEQEALTAMEPVLKALQKVHDQGLIHRDISPDNIMLPSSGGVKLIDFGTVRYLDDSGKSKSTETVLKAGFAPMEQYVTRGNLGTWTDVYALCATFHYLLTGKVPEEAMARLDGDGALPLLRNKENLSYQLIAALEKGMQVRIPDRLSSINELYQLLYCEKTRQPAQPVIPGAKTVRREPVKKKRFLPLAAASALLAAAVGFFLLKPVKQEPMVTEPVPETTLATISEEVPSAPQVNAPVMNEMDIRYNDALSLAESGELARAAIAFGKLGNYRDAQAQSSALWSQVTRRETVSACFDHFLAVRDDGTVMACCEAYRDQCDMQPWEDIIALSVSDTHAVGLRKDGTVVATGSNQYGQCDVDSWQNIVAISTSARHTVGLKANGTVVAVGEPLGNEYYATHVRTAVEEWTDIIAISTNEHQTLGLKADGTVITTQSSNWNQEQLADWQNIRAIDAANWNAIGLRSNGTAVAAGHNDWRQCDVDQWTDLTSISGGFRHTAGLKKDGTVVAVGSNKTYMDAYCGQCDVSGWQDIVFLTTGEYITLGLRRDGTLLVTGEPWYNYHNGQTEWSGIRLPD